MAEACVTMDPKRQVRKRQHAPIAVRTGRVVRDAAKGVASAPLGRRSSRPPVSAGVIELSRSISVRSPPMRATLGEVAYAKLREAIVTTSLLPGTLISENELSAVTAMSRTPLREAIRRLAEEGLVEVSPQFGTCVSKIHMRRARETIFVREAVETAVLRASPPIAERDLRSLRNDVREHRRAIAAGDRSASAELDEAFHAKLMIICGCSVATSATRSISADIYRIRFLAGADKQYFSSVADDHERLVEYLLKGDRKEAVALLGRHLAGFAVDQEILQQHARELFDPET
jgi:DNA-binding GntR family transcriptional regulator